MDIIEEIISLEWEFFQATNNRGGRAACQDDYRTFYIMRKSQALAWTEPMRAAWYADLQRAKAEGRNLVTEKYARMMAFTHPGEYLELADALPSLSPEVEQLAKKLTAQAVVWAEAAAKKYPAIISRGRPIRRQYDTEFTTSVETYCYGELMTASLETLQIFASAYEEMARAGKNLCIETISHTAQFMGYPSLEAAERAILDILDARGHKGQ